MDFSLVSEAFISKGQVTYILFSSYRRLEELTHYLNNL